MTKEQIKYFCENIETIFNEIQERLESENIEIANNITAENIRRYYDEYYRYCSDIFDKYDLDYEAFKTSFAISTQDKDFREAILGTEESNQILRDLVDIYGDEAYNILGCNQSTFKMSDIEGMLDGENNQKYAEYYVRFLNQKCKSAYTFKNLTDILENARAEYIDDESIRVFLENPDVAIIDSEIIDLLDRIPQFAQDGELLKLLSERVESINSTRILEGIPKELFDKDFAMQVLSKTQYASFSTIFKMIPEDVKDKEVWEYAISVDDTLVYSLPEETIDDSMGDEEYKKWQEEIILAEIRDTSRDILDVFRNMKEFQKTDEICREAARLIQGDYSFIESFLETIPEEKRTREIYEILSEKSINIVRYIPDETFEEGVSQEEYDKWQEEVICKAISEVREARKLYYDVPKHKTTEKVWNALLDRSTELGGDNDKLSLRYVPVQNITTEMCERALRDIGDVEIKYIPVVDRKLETIEDETKKVEYEKWVSSSSDKERQEHREWYEKTIINYLEKHKQNIFTSSFTLQSSRTEIPPEAISVKMIETYLVYTGAPGIQQIPAPSELTNYNDEYENIVLLAISKLKEKDYSSRVVTPLENWDILDIIPEEYRTNKVILEAIRKHPKYLDYADIEAENFDELLQIGYANKLSSIGRDSLTEREVELMKRFAKNNASLFSTLQLEILSPEIISSIGENSIEKIARYRDVQSHIIELASDKDALITFGFALENLKQGRIFIEPLVEQLSKSIRAEEIIEYNPELQRSEMKAGEFLKIVSSRIQDKDTPMTEQEKTIISYLALNPEEANKIKSYDEILNFVRNKNNQLDELMSSNKVTLVDAKDAYLQRTLGMSYKNAVDLVNKYGNDPETLLANYDGKELGTEKEIAEKIALENVTKLRKLLEMTDLEKVKQAYNVAVSREDETRAFRRYNNGLMLDNTLRRAYGRDITQSLNNYDKENNTESVQQTAAGQEYVLRKVNGPFNRMISVMDAYRKSDAQGDMYDRWNTSAMAGNHALCYSFIDQRNPGTAMLGDKKGVIISISGFDAEAVTALAPYDLCSDSRENTTVTYRQQKFYSASNLSEQTRGRYSEVDIEIQDVSEGVSEYRKIQPTSIICFEKVDEDSINAAIELSKKLGRTVPIELIDRRELALQERKEIDLLFDEFRSGKKLQPELVEQIITRFNNVRNAHMDSNLENELLGEKQSNTEAIFNKKHLNEMLEECIEIVEQRIQNGEVQEGLETVKQIKEFVKNEREKNVLMPTMYEKHLIAGISLDIDYKLEEVQREYGTKEKVSEMKSESLEILAKGDIQKSQTFEILHGRNSSLPEQLSFLEFKNNVDAKEVQRTVEDVHQSGYYKNNTTYSKEYVARVAMLSSAIANLEGADDKTKQLLSEAVRYHSSGRVLDDGREQYQEQSAKIAEREMSGRYSHAEIGIVQAAIELQDLTYQSDKIAENKAERESKMTEICEKYGVDPRDIKKVDDISKFMTDAVNLDNVRFGGKVNNPSNERFIFETLTTESAKSLIEASYSMHDELSSEHLSSMSKVASLDFENEKETVMDQYFTKQVGLKEVRIYSENIISSPIVQEIYFKDKFKEISDPVKVGKGMVVESKERPSSAEVKKEVVYGAANEKLPQQEKHNSMLVFTEQAIGKATINTSTQEKDNARARTYQDEKYISKIQGQAQL